MTTKKYIFFRDDDACRLDKKFLDFFHLFLRLKIPVVYGIVPAKTTPEFIDFLCRMKDRHPGMLDLAQHGYKHVNNNKAAAHSSKFEFGPSRSYHDQKKDILMGWLKMKREFQDRCAPIFIPPFHGYNFTTLRILNELSEWKNFAIFSAGNKTFPKEKFFLDIPAEISHHPKMSSSDAVGALMEKFRSQALCGILFHHDLYESSDLKNLVSLLMDLKSRPNIQPVQLSSMLDSVKQAKVHLTLALTNECHLRCKACHIWMEKPRKILSFKAIQKFVNDLLKRYAIASVSLTGGEPFLHPELENIFNYFHDLKMSGKISSLGIYSNGYQKSRIEAFLKRNEQKLDNLDLGFSVDGLEKTHDFLRGKPGSFKKVDALIARIIKKFPAVRVEAKFTISPLNAKDLWAIYQYSRRRRIGFSPKFAESDSPYYYHKKGLPQKQLNHFSERDNKGLARTLQRIIKAQMKDSGEVVSPLVLRALQEYLNCKDLVPKRCYTPFYSFFVTSSGGIHSCLNRAPLAQMGSSQWLKKLRGRVFLDIAQESLAGRCPGCLAYHGILSNANTRGDGHA